MGGARFDWPVVARQYMTIIDEVTRGRTVTVMDIAFVTTRLIDRDAQGNFSAATLSWFFSLEGTCSAAR